jgi:hypothetical protein
MTVYTDEFFGAVEAAAQNRSGSEAFETGEKDA